MFFVLALVFRRWEKKMFKSDMICSGCLFVFRVLGFGRREVKK